MAGNSEQPRVPAGSPEGGQFAPSAGSAFGLVIVRPETEHTSTVYGDPLGKFEITKNAGKYKVTRNSRGALSRRKDKVIGHYKTLEEVAADLRRIDPYGFGGEK